MRRECAWVSSMLQYMYITDRWGKAEWMGLGGHIVFNRATEHVFFLNVYSGVVDKITKMTRKDIYKVWRYIKTTLIVYKIFKGHLRAYY